MQQIQLPQGMKDTILNECEKKKYWLNRYIGDLLI